jgi:hypothetical protein
VVVEMIAILDGRVINLGREAASATKLGGIEA